VLVATMAVAGEGIDLSTASQCVFAELDDTPAVVAQAEMRTYSPARPMQSYFVVADHFVEKRIVDLLDSKTAQSTEAGLPGARDLVDALGLRRGIRDVNEILTLLGKRTG
jgi:hypothetical protein